jgi:hypothetical protein
MVTSSMPMPMPAMKRHRSTSKPEGEDRAAAVTVGEMAEEDGADEQAGEQREHEGADAGDAIGAEDVEDAERFRLEVARADQARRDIGGEEQVV